MRDPNIVDAIEPKFILNLDELPQVLEADGIVYPVFLPLRGCALLFGTTPTTIQRWVNKYDLPAIKVGTDYFIEVGPLNDWIWQHSVRVVDEALRKPRKRGEDVLADVLEDADAAPTTPPETGAIAAA